MISTQVLSHEVYISLYIIATIFAILILFVRLFLFYIAMRQGCLLILSQKTLLNSFAQYFKPGLCQERVLLITLHSNVELSITHTLDKDLV